MYQKYVDGSSRKFDAKKSDIVESARREKKRSALRTAKSFTVRLINKVHFFLLQLLKRRKTLLKDSSKICCLLKFTKKTFKKLFNQ
jgi:hypothetical protein